MALNNIEQLLEKYLNGETTLNEEAQLKHYFTNETVAPHLQMYTPMFNYFNSSKQEQFTKDIPLKPKQKTSIYKWISVAAVAVLLIGLYFNNTSKNELGTYQNPELAYAEVVKTLQLVSESLNQGKQQIQYLDNINQARTQVTYLNEMDNATSIIFKPKN